MPRLVHTAAAREQLLAAIAAQPAGAKLSIPQLRDALVNQADVLDALRALVDAGRLDRRTLRPVVPAGAPRVSVPKARKVAPARELRPTGAQLWRRLMAVAEPLGMPQTAVSRAVFGNSVQMCTMRTARMPVRAATLERAEAWLKAPQPHIRGTSGTARKAPCAEESTSATRIEDRVPSDEPAAIRAFLADPPIAEFRRKRECETAQADSVRQRKLKQRDPTQPPGTDPAEQQRVAAARQFAASRRTSEQRAAALVDAGADPAKQNSMVKAQMRQIEARRADEVRLADPVEQAKLALQRKGRVVHSAAIHGGRRGFFMVGGQRDASGRLREISPGELLDLAEKVTGQCFRRVA